MAHNGYEEGTAWAWAAMEPEPTENERVILDRFCSEYLVDGDATLAACRCGFVADIAVEYGKAFFAKSYVQQRLASLRRQEPDRKAEEQYNRRLVINTLRDVAANPYADKKARVAAAAKLAEIYDMTGAGATARHKRASEGGRVRGVIVVPARLSIEEWESVAAASQAKLAEESRVE